MVTNQKAQEILAQIKEWLSERGCEECVPEGVLERYASCSARWLECEEQVDKFGLLIKTSTGHAGPSPYAVMGQTYFDQANKLWLQICKLAEAERPGLF